MHKVGTDTAAWRTVECMSIHMSIHMPIHMPVHISMHMSIQMAVPTSIHMSIRMSVHMSMHMPMHMSMHMPIHISIHMSVRTRWEETLRHGALFNTSTAGWLRLMFDETDETWDDGVGLFQMEGDAWSAAFGSLTCAKTCVQTCVWTREQTCV